MLSRSLSNTIKQKMGAMFGAYFLGALLALTIPSSVWAATFTQTDWSSGIPADSTACTTAGGTWDGTQCLAADPANQTGWAAYSSKDTDIVEANGGLDLKLGSVSISSTHTNQADFAPNNNQSKTHTTKADFSTGATLTNVFVTDRVTLGVVSHTPIWTAKTAWDVPDDFTQSAAKISLGDLDGDGDFDVMVGNSTGDTKAYKNTGSVTSPAWTKQSTWDIPDVDAAYSADNASPALVDLDGDGDLDALVGNYPGITTAFENTGTIGPSWAAKPAWDLGDTGTYAAPAVVNFGGDSDYDLFNGDNNGISYAYENTGDSSSPTWTAKTAWNLPDIGTRANPSFVDIDSDGDDDLLVGDNCYVIHAYENTGSNTSPTWTAKPAWEPTMPPPPSFCIGGTLSPDFADLDDDGDQDMIVGENTGAGWAYENTATTTYQTSGSVESAVIDTGGHIGYDTIGYTASIPANTALTVDIRAGDNATVDGTWTSWLTGVANGADISSLGNKRYFQYKINLSNTVSTVTPRLDDITVNYLNFPYGTNAHSSPLGYLGLSTDWTPMTLGTYSASKSVGNVAVSGNYLFGTYHSVLGYSKLRVFNVSNLSAPTYVTQLSYTDAYDLFISGNYVYVAIGEYGLSVVNITTPTSPSVVGSFDTGGIACNVYVAGTTAYIADSYAGLRVLDVSNPANPTAIGWAPTDGTGCAGIKVSGNYLYMGDGPEGVVVFDITDPTQPSKIAEIPGNTYNVWIEGNYLYAIGTGLQVYDVSNPASPTFVASNSTISTGTDIFYENELLYVIDNGVLKFVDVADPSNPAVKASYETSLSGVYVVNSVVYAGTYDVKIIKRGQYQTPAQLTSSVMDMGQHLGYTTLDYTAVIPANTTLTVDVRAGNTAVPDGTWSSWITGVANGGSISALSTNRYFQYRVNMTTTDVDVSPALNDITVNVDTYSSASALISTPYDTGSVSNILTGISWNETLPASTDIRIQLRSAADSSGSPGTWSEWFGPDSSSNSYWNSANTTVVDSGQCSGSGSISCNPAAIARDLIGDQWLQYKVEAVTTDPDSTPTFSDVTLSYATGAAASGQFVISQTSGLVTTEAGTTATFTIQLNSSPSANVVIDLYSDDISEGTVSPSQVTFNSGNWNSPVTITITGVNDAIDDGDVGYNIIIGTAISTDGTFGGLNPPDVSVTNSDDDTGGITVDTVDGIATSENGTIDSFSIVLDSQPLADVTIGISSDDTTEATVDKSSLIFTAANWNITQTVFVTGANDDAVDGTQPYNIVIAAAVSSDGFYNAMNPADIAATNTDNDTVDVIISPGGLTTTEKGGGAAFNVKLGGRPDAPVMFSLTTSDTSEGYISLLSQNYIFQPDEWNTPKTGLITGINDAIIDPAQGYFINISAISSADTVWNGVTPAAVPVTNIDDDSYTINIVQNTESATTEAGGFVEFVIRLSTAPSSPVTIPLSVSDTTEATVVSEVTFLPTDLPWDGKTVHVYGVDDRHRDGSIDYTLVIGATVTDDVNFQGIDLADIPLTNLDDEVNSDVIVSGVTGAFSGESITSGDFNNDNIPDLVVGATEDSSAGKVRLYLGSASGYSSTPDWSAIGDSSTQFGNALAAGDFNNDGYDDLVVGAEYETGNTPTNEFREGRVFVFYGSASGMPDADADGLAHVSDASWLSEADQSYSYMGHSVAIANVNNDAYADLVVSANYYNNDQTSEGRVYVFHGSATGLSYTDCGGFADGIAHPCEANWTAEGDYASGYFGKSVARAGDVNGDTYDDIIIGSDYYSNGQTYEGRALVYYGSATGLPYTNCGGLSDGIAHVCEAAWQVESDLGSSRLGYSVAGAGDINNDGYDDVIVGAPYRSNGNTYEGIAYVFHGSNTGLADAGADGLAYPSDAAWQLEGNATYAYLGMAFAGGVDFNGDNIDDVALGVRGNGVGGEMLVFFGVQTTGLNATADWQHVETNTDFRLLGFSIAGIPDYNGDGYDELVVGAPETEIGVFQEGAVKIFTPNIIDPGFTITPASGLQTTESGGTTTFTVRLTAYPEADVTLGLNSLDTSEGVISHSSLTFTQANWNIPQTVTITGVNDAVTDGNVAYVIETTAASSTDAGYNNLNPVNIGVTNIDNDVPQAITVTSNGSIQENGGTGIFTFTRAGEITSDLTVYYTVSGTATGGSDYTTLPGAVTIPIGSASAVVSVIPTENLMVEPDETVIVDITSGAGYVIGSPSSATVTIVDDDTAGILTSTQLGLLTTEAGGSASFTVQLKSQPTDDVTIVYGSSDTSEGVVHPASITFTSANWNVAQTITVVGQSDGIVDNDINYTVSAPGATSIDSQYSGMVAPSISVTNLDDGSRATVSLAVSKASVDESEEGTGYASFIITRSGATTDPLSVFYSVLGTADTDIDYLAAGNMVTIQAGVSTAQINIYPIQDTKVESIETVIVNILNSSDYVVAPPASATVVITDDESPVPPTANFAVDQVVAEGGSFTVQAILNQQAASYPVTIPFTVGGSAVNPADHNAVSGNIVIASGTVGSSSSFSVQNDGSGEGDETIIFTMGTPTNAVVGAHTVHTVTVTEANVKPEATLQSVQSATTTRLIVTGNGNVTVTATVDDPNVGDTAAYDWSATNNNLIDIPESGSDDPATFVFDPSGLTPGFYAVRLKVTDSGALFSNVELLLEVVSSAPTLSALVDSDGDSIADADESFDDSDGDGIPDYLDSSTFASNELQVLSGESASYLMRTEVGLSLKLGETAFAAGADGALVTVDDISAYGGGEGQSGTASAVDTVVNVGGYFDFEIVGLETAGQSVQVVIPQLVALPGGAVYRKYDPNSGWADFVEDANNSLASAIGLPGECPLPGSSQYQPGLNEGYYCVQLTIQDGGSNDMDGVANYVIQDPGQFGEAPAAAASTPNNSTAVVSNSSGGGALSLGDIMMLLVLAISLTQRKRIVVAYISFSVVIFVLPQQSYAEFSMNFQPLTQNGAIVTDYYLGTDCGTNCTPFLVDEVINDPAGIEQAEIVFDPTTNSSYIHMIVGDLSTGFIQESYVEIVNGSECFGSYCWARGAFDGDLGGSDIVGNGLKPLDSNASFSGNGTANPNKVLIRQIVNDGELTSEFLKDQYDKKPVIAQTVINAQMQMTTLVDMRNSDYNTSAIEGLVINTMSLTGADAPPGAGAFNGLTDSQNAVVTAGKYTYTEGAGRGGASGTYTYESSVYDVTTIEWTDYFDTNDPSNVWSVSDFIPQ